MRQAGRGWRAITILVAALFWLTGCASSTYRSGAAEPTVQKVEYYPYQVKGYQNSYAKRRILILMPIDAHQPAIGGAGIAAPPAPGDVAIGVSEDPSGRPTQELYSAPLAPIVQNAIAQSATEAGLIASTAPGSIYAPTKDLNDDYVLVSRIVKCWVDKRPGPGGEAGPAWFSAAEFALEVTIYKPPFTVPFWQGRSGSNYDDPPMDSNAISPEDETAIYDQPVQVLSVAMTRAVAGIFNRTELYALVNDDRMPARR
ncbi:MAG TPA: hypothetical protein VMV15_02060 [Candidatus Binataceae bacterium]|nr:hypothetical protein [Candidatus Binataceae bacterium]